jgi:type IV pilus modification protein PilV
MMVTRKTSQTKRQRQHQAGFSLIEALIALLVVAFGLLSIASFQYTLSRASDIAKQRTEATRIAQRELDRLRSFAQREAETTPDPDRLTYVEDLIDAGPTAVAGVTTNTTFSLQSDFTTLAGDRYRWVNVIVTWADRTGQTQSVNLTSAISDGDPSDLGVLGVQRRVASTLRPKNRNINIPYPAVNLAGGASSAFVPPPGNTIFTFNNVSGDVTQSCRSTAYVISAITRSGVEATATASGHPFTTGMRVTIVGASPAGYNGEVTVTAVSPGVSFTYVVSNVLATPATLTGATATRAVVLTEGIDLTTLTGVTCTTYSTPAYLLSGYVRFKTQGAAASASNIDEPNDLTDPTLPLAATIYNTATSTFTSQPLTIASSATGNGPAGYECYAQRQLTVRSNAGQSDLTIAEGDPIPSGYSDSNAPRFISYTCIVVPIDHDSVAATRPIWSGEVTLNPSGWTFGSGSGDRRLCRFTSDYNRDNTLSNGEHPRYYRQVSGALDSQNYLVINRNDDCPTDIASNPATGNYLDTNTARHQPSPELSFRCTSTACNGSDRVATESSPSNPAAAIPME